MKPTTGRIRALTELAEDGAYMRPNRSIRGSLYVVTPSMEGMFRHAGLIEESPPPAHEKLGYVWTITAKGRIWLTKARAMFSNAQSEPTARLFAQVGSTDGLCHMGEK